MEKKLPDLIAQIRAAHPDVLHWDLWTMDEHRIGLKPIVRRIWARSGERPIITVQQRYQWRYVYGFVCPQRGETFWLILPTVTVEVFSQALAELAQFLGLGPDKHLILVLDQAGWQGGGARGHPSALSTGVFPGAATGRAVVGGHG